MSVENINLVIKCIVTLASVLLTTYFIPWLKSKVSASRLEELKCYAEIAVRSAEQLYASDQFTYKKDYALEYVSEKANELGIDITPYDLNTIIESTVNYIKYSQEYRRDGN